MGDLEEAKRLLWEADNLLTQLYLKEPDDNDKRNQIHYRHTDTLALLENMEEPITERFQLQIDKYNEMIALLKEIKDMIEPPEEPVLPIETDEDMAKWDSEHPDNPRNKPPEEPEKEAE